MQHKCLSIAGFDSSGGAGIQADLKTFSALGCYGMTVLTALPIQNTLGVRHCYEIPTEAIQAQLEIVFADIIPNSIKIGMLFNTEIIYLVADFLKKHANDIPIVLDPVMVAKSGEHLLLPEAIDALKTVLIPLVTLVTPNLPEAYTLTGTSSSMPILANQLLDLGARAVFLKGGHRDTQESSDLFMDQTRKESWFHRLRIISKNTHGTGCTLSAAITAYLARGFPLLDTCKLAKDYLFAAIKAAQHNSVGHGHGPVHHFHHLWPLLAAELPHGKP